jgi:Zn-dependent peptidase ImmA (M78 family)/DNA-binding XRE family transcriptional regulator
MIYPERVRQARELKGLTQQELAEKVGVTQSTIANIESNRRLPSSDLLDNIARATDVRPSFFEQPPTLDLPEGSLTPRQRKGVAAIERYKAHQYGRLCVEQLRKMSNQLNLPTLVSPVGEDPIASAIEARKALGIPEDKPIPNLINALERKGFIVIALPFELDKLDAFSTWANIDQERPVIVVASGKPGDRLRSSVAHELGHIVLHRGLHGDVTAMENEANLFAGAFLLPEQPMREQISGSFNLPVAARMKLRWAVSMQLLIRRARDLGIITERRYRYLFEQIGALGWKKREPANLDIPVEKPRAFRKMAQLCYGPLQEAELLASDMHVTFSHAQALLDHYSLGITWATLEGTEEYLSAGKRLNLN